MYLARKCLLKHSFSPLYAIKTHLNVNAFSTKVLIEDTPGDGAANFWWPSKVSKGLAVCGVLAVASLP